MRKAFDTVVKEIVVLTTSEQSTNAIAGELSHACEELSQFRARFVRTAENGDMVWSSTPSATTDGSGPPKGSGGCPSIKVHGTTEYHRAVEVWSRDVHRNLLFATPSALPARRPPSRDIAAPSAYLAEEGDNGPLIRRALAVASGDDFATPSRPEFFMLQAWTAALQSASVSKRVGAVLTAGDRILATGYNEIAAAGGGLLGPESPVDYRDFQRSSDPTSRQAAELKRLLGDLVSLGLPLNVSTGDALEQVVKRLMSDPTSRARARVLATLNAGRAIHAEMSALLMAARSGLAVQGSVLYVTHRPCSRCVEHLLAAGVSEVVYQVNDLQVSEEGPEPFEASEPDREESFVRAYIGVDHRLFWRARYG